MTRSTPSRSTASRSTPSRSTRSRAAKAEHVGMDLYQVRVSAVRQLTPHLRRITLQDEHLRGFRDDGPDQRVKLLLPRTGQRRPLTPDPQRWYDDWLQMPHDTRPILRTYTVRAARPEQSELDIDFVLHGVDVHGVDVHGVDPALHEGAGPGSAWAAQAQPGDEVALFGAWAEYEVAPQVEQQLIIGDHTALPAIAAIIERFSATIRGRVVIEVPGAADELVLPAPPGVSVEWVHREGAPGARLAAAVRNIPAFTGETYAWVAADQATVAVIRRHLVTDRGLAPTSIMFMGYWRTDGAIDG